MAQRRGARSRSVHLVAAVAVVVGGPVREIVIGVDVAVPQHTRGEHESTVSLLGP